MTIPSSREIAINAKRKDTELECCSKKRYDANQQSQDSRKKQPQQARPKYNSKLVCNSFDYTSHSAWDCSHRTKGATAFRNVPYDKQTTDENRKLRKGPTKLHKRAPLNEVTEQTDFPNSYESEEDPSSNWSRHVTHSQFTKVGNMSHLNVVHVLEKQKKNKKNRLKK